ncbi:MAG: ABC transporter substrate-binding protein [Solirubrobacterales bacterium]
MMRISSALAALLLALFLAACGSGSGDETSDSSAASSDEPLTLGFAIGETGFMAPFDDPARTAAQFAMDDVNADGGIDGRQVEMVSADTKSKPELSGDAATDVLGQGADIVVTSCDFDQGSPAAIVAQDQGVLAFSTCAGSTAFGPEGIGPLAFTMATAAPAEGAAMAEWAMDKGYTKAATLLDDTIEFTKQSNYGFETRYEDLGGDLVAQETFKQGDQSLASQINAIKAADPDVIYLASYMPSQASAMKQIRAAGIDAPILADEDVDGDYWKEALPDISDVYYATYASIYGDDPDDKVNELVDRYKEKTGKLPDNSAFLTGYAMVQAIQKAIEDADGSTDGQDLSDQLQTFDDEQFLLPTTFDEQYHITLKRTLRLMEIQDGKTSFLEEHTPEDVPIPSN